MSKHLPVDPSLKSPRGFEAMLEPLFAAIAAGEGAVDLPRLPGIDPRLLVRWLHMRHAESANKQVPFAIYDRGRRDASLYLDVLAKEVAGGWLHVFSDSRVEVPGVICVRVAGDTLPAPEAWGALLRSVVEPWATVTDPGIDLGKLLSRLSEGSDVELVGAADDCLALAMRAHARLAPDAPLHVGRAGPGPGWWVVPDADEVVAQASRAADRRVLLLCRARKHANFPPTVVGDVLSRGTASIRQAILRSVDGRPITASALNRLAAHRWADREAFAAALRGLSEVATVDDDAVTGQIGAPPGRAIRLKRLGGTTQRFDAPALVIGRARKADDLGAKGTPRRDLVDRLAGADAVYLPYPDVPALSRVHAVVLRQRDTLVVHTVPDVKIGLTARPLQGAWAPMEVVVGAPVSIGEDGELVFGPPESPVMQMRVALAAAPEAVDTGAARQAAEAAEERALRLDPLEARALTALVLSYTGVDFTRHARTTARGARLQALLAADLPETVCARLLLAPANLAVLEAIADEIDNARRKKLPPVLMAAIDRVR